MKNIIVFVFVFFSLSPCVRSAPRVLAFNDDGTRLLDFYNTPLYNGNSISGGGDILEIGYFSDAASSTPFAGEWNILITYRIGDKDSPPPGPGMFRYNDPVSATDLLGGTNLAIRFYDAPSPAAATYYNTVTDSTGAWTWTPGVSTDPLILSFADSTLVWQDGPGSAFRTTIPVPEPSSLLILAILLLQFQRRRVRGLS